MSLGPSIVCPVDFSEGSRAALCYAAAVADHFGARLVVMTVDDPLLVEAAAISRLEPSLPAESEAELRRFAAETLPSGAVAGAKKLEFLVTVGKPAIEILQTAKTVGADLIVISSHGRSGLRKMFFGSTTERVLRETTTPVLITPPERPASLSLSEIASHIQRVVTPVDLTPASRRQVMVASAVAEALSVPLLVAHVLEPIYVPSRVRGVVPDTSAARRAKVDAEIAELAAAVSRGVTCEKVVVSGEPAEEIVKLAQSRGARLIVMGLHSGGLFGPRMGAVTYRVLCTAGALVMALPPEHAAE